MVIKHEIKEINTDEPICIINDVYSKKWYANKPFTRQYSEMFDDEDSLKDSLSKKNNKWFSLQEHIDMMIESFVK